MVDPVVVKGSVAVAKLTLGKALARWKDHANRSTEALLEAEAAEGRKWRVERDHLVEQRLNELEGDAELQHELGKSLAQTLEELLEDPQFFRLSRNYDFEAAREATDERRRMLAFAAAWSVEPGLSISQLARVERTIRELDPADVAVLKQLAELQRSPVATLEIPETSRGNAEHERLYEDMAWAKHLERLHDKWRRCGPAGEVLPASGCVYVAPGGNRYDSPAVTLEVTALGVNVLRVLNGYLRSNALDDQPKESA